MRFAAGIFALALFLEALGLAVFTRVAAHPDLLLGVVVIVALSRPAPAGALTGFFLGLLRDLVYGNPLGMEILPLTLIGWLAGSLGRTVYRESLVTQVVVVFAAGLVKGFLNYTLLRQGDLSGIFLYEVRISLLASALTAGSVPIAYGLVRWLWRERQRLKRLARDQLRNYEKKLLVKR